MAVADCEAQWLSYLLQDLQCPLSSPIPLFSDNNSAIHIATNPVLHAKTKHIEMDCHTIKEKITSGLLHLLPILSKDQTANIFTKTLYPGPFQLMVSKLGLIDIYRPACGEGVA